MKHTWLNYDPKTYDSNQTPLSYVSVHEDSFNVYLSSSLITQNSVRIDLEMESLNGELVMAHLEPSSFLRLILIPTLILSIFVTDNV